MEPHEFTNPNNTVFRYDQIITRNDVIMFIQMLEDQYAVMTNKEEREHLITAIKTLDTLLTWLTIGKNRDFEGML